MSLIRFGLVSGLSLAAALPATAQGPSKFPTQSAPISNISYDVTFDSTTATQRTIKVTMTFTASGSGEVLLSLPSWTPGAYEISNYARYVSEFTPMAAGKPVSWDKTNPDTWRLRTTASGTVTVAFDFQADSLDNAFAWTQPNFAFFNGTNLFLYPEGRSPDFPATVRIHTQDGWKVATGMHAGAEAGSYSEKNYHDLVDMPFFVGRFDFDSNQVGTKMARLPRTRPVS